MIRQLHPGNAARRTAAVLALAALAALPACRADGPTSPVEERAVQLAFVDNLFRLTLLESGGTPVTTSVSGIVPFAATAGLLAYWQGDTLRLYDVPSGVSRPTAAVGAPATMALEGALSRDGRRVAFVSGAAGSQIFLHVVDLETGARDSADLVPRVEPTTTVRVLTAPPEFSPDGDRIGFLLPTLLAMHFFIVEPLNWRTEQHLLWIATSTTVQVIPGRPRWLTDGHVRFVARKRALDATPVDTMMLLSFDPDRGELGALIEHQAAMPDTLSLDQPRNYSLTADGRAAALTVTANGRDGIFLLREGHDTVEPLVFGASQMPRYPIIVP
jgi:hypothetical protein